MEEIVPTSALANAIAKTVHSQFDSLPSKRKPTIRGNGVVEWVPLSGVVAEFPDGSLQCLSLATGAKVLPRHRIAAGLNGLVLHDSHAEVLAIRGFNHVVLSSCLDLLEADQRGDKNAAATVVGNLVEWAAPWRAVMETGGDEKIQTAEEQSELGPPFVLRAGVRLHLYGSEAPCGDASMELTMAGQREGRAEAWQAQVQVQDPEPDYDFNNKPVLEPPDKHRALELAGRANFARLAIVRRKPGRGDAPTSLSKSCSDKIALRQARGLLCAAASLLVCPVGTYLESLVLPQAQLDICATGCERAFATRLALLINSKGIVNEGDGSTNTQADDTNYVFHPLSVLGTDSIFAYSKAAAEIKAAKVLRQGVEFSYSGTARDRALEKRPKQRMTESNVRQYSAKIVDTSNISTVWTASLHHHANKAAAKGQSAKSESSGSEGIIGGILQGHKPPTNDAAAIVAASQLCRANIWRLARRVADGLVSRIDTLPGLSTHELKEGTWKWQIRDIVAAIYSPSYVALKACSRLAARRDVSQHVKSKVLKGWARNSGDEDFALTPHADVNKADFYPPLWGGGI